MALQLKLNTKHQNTKDYFYANKKALFPPAAGEKSASSLFSEGSVVRARG